MSQIKILNPLTLIFTLATAFGVVFHDTQSDRAALALAVPASIVGFAAVDAGIKRGDSHVHVERVSGPSQHASKLRSSLPRVQPRDEDRRYVQSKKLFVGGGDAHYIWPSV